MKKILKSLLTLLLVATLPGFVQAQNTNNVQAQHIFIKVYESIFNSDGCQLSYDVNIIGLYKSKGSIAYKGKKQQYNESKVCSWNDGKTIHRADLKKKEIHIYRVDDENRSKYMSKFKFNPDDYSYSMKEDGDYYEITAKVKNSKMFGVKDAVARITKKDQIPVHLSVKVAFLRANVAISNFKTGNISDDIFVFPKERFKSYKIIDHQLEN